MISENRQKALSEIWEHIAQYGFHTYIVTGGGYPHFGYTIGLTESLGAELILAGAYYYRLDDISKVIKTVVAKLQSIVSWHMKPLNARPWGTFALRKVDRSWAEALMLGAFDFYGVNNIEAYQIVPDEAHWTIDVPDLTQPWTPSQSPGWRWLKEEWEYPVPKDSVALTDLNALRGGRITEVMRWEEDQWEIFATAGPDTTEADRRVVPLGILLATDPSLLPAVNLPVGSGLWRDAESEWHAWQSSKN